METYLFQNISKHIWDKKRSRNTLEFVVWNPDTTEKVHAIDQGCCFFSGIAQTTCLRVPYYAKIASSVSVFLNKKILVKKKRSIFYFFYTASRVSDDTSSQRFTQLFLTCFSHHQCQETKTVFCSRM